MGRGQQNDGEPKKTDAFSPCCVQDEWRGLRKTKRDVKGGGRRDLAISDEAMSHRKACKSFGGAKKRVSAHGTRQKSPIHMRKHGFSSLHAIAQTNRHKTRDLKLEPQNYPETKRERMQGEATASQQKREGKCSYTPRHQSATVGSCGCLPGSLLSGESQEMSGK
jgi:hypothetical protein